jgi:hypothetical protein
MLVQDHTLALYETGPFVEDGTGQVEDMLRLRHSFSYPANPEVRAVIVWTCSHRWMWFVYFTDVPHSAVFLHAMVSL